MADWIRMRSSLPLNPRVTKMARLLLAEREFLDWLCPGCDVPVTSNESVMKRHIPVVTRVVVGGLLLTWSMVNDTAARDGVVRHAALRDIDETAGIPGFGAALFAVRAASHAARTRERSIEKPNRAVLGGMLLDNSAWDRVGDLLTDSDFYRYEHRLIFDGDRQSDQRDEARGRAHGLRGAQGQRARPARSAAWRT
jgi:hypothetical protein